MKQNRNNVDLADDLGSGKGSKLWAHLVAINRLRIVGIKEVKKESPTVKTLTFHDKLCGKARPGQFLMVWIPGVDEVPMSISNIHPSGHSSITVARVGDATKALHQRKPGETLGIRGPYGNGFVQATGNILIIGGGTGLAPLLPLAEALGRPPTKITFVLGAKTKDELIFLYRIKATLSEVNARVIATTEDGSYGLKGLVTDSAERILAKDRFDMVYACGPEQMMRKVFLLAERNKTPLQVSLERFMRCGMGLCGSCMIGAFRVCKDGPVFSSEQLRQVKNEFGYFKREPYGRKVEI